MNKKIKRIGKGFLILGTVYLIGSGAYVAHNLENIVFGQEVIANETEITEQQVLEWLENEAKKSDFVKDRMQIAEETFKGEFKANTLENLKHKTNRTFEELVAESEVRARIITNDYE